MTTEINARIEQIKRGKVPKGYKKTKVGIVPKEWEVKKLSDLAKYKTEKNKTNQFKCTLTNSANLGIIQQTEYFDKEISNSDNISGYYVVNKGDYVYNPRISVKAPCGPINKSHIVETGIMSPLYTVFKFNSETNDYYEHYFHSSNWYSYMNEIANYGARSDRMNVTNDDFFAMPLPHINGSEQQKIADILTTQDKVIDLKEKLIAEKQQQKKYLMQNLLTGKKRLKGFSGEWKIRKLSSFSSKITTKNTDNNFELVFTNSAQHGILPQRDHFDKDIANVENINGYYIVEPNCFVYNPRISVTAPCGPINCNLTGCTGVMSPLYTVFKINDKGINTNYLIQYFLSTIWFKYAKSVANYGVRFDRMNITDEDFFSMRISLPTLKEQTAIAEILSTADREIELLQKQLAEEKQKKKALMQLLLTGIVRV